MNDKQGIHITYSHKPIDIADAIMNIIKQGKYIVQIVKLDSAIIILYNNV